MKTSDIEMEHKRQLENIEKEITEIKKEIQAYRKRTRNDIRQIFHEILSEKCIAPIANKRNHEINQILELKLPKECDLNEMCIKEFSNAFEELYNEFKEQKIQKIKKISNKKKKELKTLEKEMPYQKCEKCFKMVLNTVEEEVQFIEQLCIDEIQTNITPKEEDIDKEIVEEIISPLSNKARLKILSTLADDSKSFSQLSEIVKLEGGNLMFHLNQLREKEFIVQKHKGGEYWITTKGKRVISGLRLISKTCKN
ncbi:Transcriptional regulator containing HTH domain ArsR family [Methanonatronarchaeum thermophilum]|uniref:Transcriptional regulator containing HTH domain ArsR family n=1 Tax=Methanonatronarchaeum thermophilum TaxID=1927129 RepID=A0A1Y3GC75_9EURY|nr:winged helix-turn-helix domain-containing protein [Methanonatronarchaeum thermophilum]OUJ18857.1 Transcriptional regulator containing HTH domain ArsR family [Methanonatronarchaeum thermophilum]